MACPDATRWRARAAEPAARAAEPRDRRGRAGGIGVTASRGPSGLCSLCTSCTRRPRPTDLSRERPGRATRVNMPLREAPIGPFLLPMHEIHAGCPLTRRTAPSCARGATFCSRCKRSGPTPDPRSTIPACARPLEPVPAPGRGHGSPHHGNQVVRLSPPLRSPAVSRTRSGGPGDPGREPGLAQGEVVLPHPDEPVVEAHRTDRRRACSRNRVRQARSVRT